MILSGKALLYFSHKESGSKDESLENILLELCPSLIGCIASLLIPFSHTATIKSLTLNLLYSSTYLLISFSAQSPTHLFISKSINSSLFFTLLIHYLTQLSYIQKNEKIYIFKESYFKLFASILIITSSLSFIFAYLYYTLLNYFSISQFSLLYYSAVLTTFSISLYFLYKSPEIDSNILETEPAEAVNTKTIHSEKSFPDNCKSFITVQANYNENLNLSVDEKSIQDFEYNCVGINCGYFFDEAVFSCKGQMQEKSEGIGMERKSRKSNSFDDVIVERSNEESENDYLDVEGKGDSVEKKRRNSEGSKIDCSELVNRGSLCSDQDSSYHSLGVLKEGSLSSLP